MPYPIFADDYYDEREGRNRSKAKRKSHFARFGKDKKLGQSKSKSDKTSSDE
ncbi:MAG: hypothetical protein ABEI53_03590 [Candidatus Magasanikbacteria bacterium]